MTKYNVSPLVAREIEFSTGTNRETEIFQQLAVSELFNQLNK